MNSIGPWSHIVPANVRLSQQYVRKSVDVSSVSPHVRAVALMRSVPQGLSMSLFVFAFLGNFFYVLSILTSPKLHQPEPASSAFLRESIP